MTSDEQAIEEIKAILERRDLAAMVIVVSPDHAAYLRHITPSWSCAWMEDKGGRVAVHVRSKREDYPNLEAQKRSVEATTGMFITFMNWLRATADDMESIIGLIARHFPDIRHWEDHGP